MIVAIMLSVLVCVVGALLLTVPGYYNGFWVFALCFVIATTHFSLIKVNWCMLYTHTHS